MKKVIVLGSTGSIGRSTLDVLKKNRGRFKVIGLSAWENTPLLQKQIREFSPFLAAVGGKLKARPGSRTKILIGKEGVNELSRIKSDIVVLGISGIAALGPLLECIGRTKRILLANKEAVVSAWPLIKAKLKNSGTEIIPVDSEANALFQLLLGVEKKSINKVYITASGGPFLNWDKKRLTKVKASQALQHPTWKMGRRITIDSATLVNKGFEVMEAHFLFDIPLDKIEVIIHPQSVIHSLVETYGGCLFASFFAPDMRVPINYALNYPDMAKHPIKKLDLVSLRKIEFFKPDCRKFSGLKLALSAAKKGKSMPAVFTAADEQAVNLYLQGKIRFTQIPEILRIVLAKHRPKNITCLEDVLFWMDWAKNKVMQNL
ncbi:1-deoxy-D-xylulose-5-phosphate reductoisomerase [bacterium]|nr:MAG: 1-deoxy-D-xylulose-5-phosphate reductoisomerase [bacterium]